MKLRSHVRQIQVLENRAAEKAGARFVLFEMGEVLKRKGREKYVQRYIDSLLKDIKPELEKSAKKGVELYKAINK